MESSKDTEDKQPIQCFVVGDSDVGKTFCLYTFTTKSYPNEYTSRSFSDLKVSVEVEGKKLSLLLCDSSGRRDYAQFRKLVYPKTDVVVLCFAVNSPESMSNVRTYWFPEIKRECPFRPVLLVGTKADTRQSICDAARIVSSRNGEDLAREIGACEYLECSALTCHNIDALFERAAILGEEFAKRKVDSKRSSCAVM